MKKKVFAIIVLFLLVTGVWTLLSKPSISKPDQMQVIIEGEVTEIAPEEDIFDQIYKMMNEAWETSMMGREKPVQIMLTHLNPGQLEETNVEIRFIYEKDIKLDKGSERVAGNTLSFFPFELECVAFSRDANYLSNAVVYVFSLTEEQEAEWNALME